MRWRHIVASRQMVPSAGVTDVAIELPRPITAAMLRSLTPRQQYIVAVLGESDTFNEAAARLGISATALTARVRSISHRLGFPSQHELIKAARQHAVLEDVEYGIYALGSDGRCLFANRRAGEMFGYPSDELLGLNIHDLLHYKHADGSPYPAEDCPIRRTLSVRDPEGSGVELFWHRDGSAVWVTYRASIGAESEDSPVRIVVTIDDCTPQVRAREEMELSGVRWDLALAAAGIVAIRVDLTTGALLASANFGETIGEVDRSPSTFGEFVEWVHPDDRPLLARIGEGKLAANAVYQGEFRVVRADGTERRLRGRAQVVPDALGVDRTLVGVATDITEAHEAEAANRFMLEMSSDAFVGVDGTGEITHWNPAAERLFGWRAEEALGSCFERLFPERSRLAHRAELDRIASGPGPYAAGPIEITVCRFDGTEVPVEVHLAGVPSPQGMAFRAFVRDISTRQALEKALIDKAVTDHLTGLPNRVLLRDRLDVALKRCARSGLAVAVLFIDIDRFKLVNDSLGHGSGDALLREAAARLQATVRPGDTVARFGDDEFVVVCEDLDALAAQDIGERLLDALLPPVGLGGYEVQISASVGIAVSTSEATADGLLPDAHAAMHRAKQRGRNRVELFDAGMRDRVVAQLEMESALRHALADGELRLHYQPIVRLEDGRVRGVEALLRWTRPGFGNVSPAEFIPVAEESGLIVPIGEWALRTACDQAAAWHRTTGADIEMAVNLSGRQFAHTDLVALVDDAAAAAGISPDRLCLEITESVLMDDSAASEATMRRLRELGVRLAVDDFGTGYSSLLYLRQFPVQVLKMDRLFVAGLGRDDQDTAIVQATVDLAHALGLEALAEGVERPEQLETLRAMGCDSAQGFLWSPAVPADEIEAMLLSDASSGPAQPAWSSSTGRRGADRRSKR